jgi:hypothetical protein
VRLFVSSLEVAVPHVGIRVPPGSQLTTLQDSLKASELALKLKQEEVDALKQENADLRQKLVATRPLERKAANANAKLAKAVEIIQTMRSERVNLAVDAQTVRLRCCRFLSGDCFAMWF